MRIKNFFFVILFLIKEEYSLTRNAIIKPIMAILSDKNSANKQWLCMLTASDKVD